jgi:hypothetical protein
MSIFEFIKAIFSAKYICEYFIEGIEFSYHKHRENFPGSDPHFYLAQAWLAYMKAKGENINSTDMQMAAFTTTYLCACVPHPKCARALGIFLLYRERPEKIKKRKVLQDEFNQLILPVLEAQKNGSILNLYREYNPNMEKMKND